MVVPFRSVSPNLAERNGTLLFVHVQPAFRAVPSVPIGSVWFLWVGKNNNINKLSTNEPHNEKLGRVPFYGTTWNDILGVPFRSVPHKIAFARKGTERNTGPNGTERNAM